MVNLLLKKSLAAAAASVMTFIPLCRTVPEKSVNGAEPDEYHDDWLHVNENAEIVDMYGNPVWLTGCNWFGYNVTTQVFDGVWSRNMHEMLNEMADHGFNFLRVPMSTQLLLQWKNNEPDPYMVKINEWKNPELTVEGIEGGTPKYSFDIWNQAVEWCRENGIKIMIDIHCATTASNGHQHPLWYDDNYSTEDWLEALSWVADYYKDDDTILAIDLKNEPHGTADQINIMAKWDDSTDPTNWKYAAERGAAAVLESNPNLLVMVEGTEVYPKFEDGNDWTSPNIDYSRYPYSYYHHTWWGGNFRGVKDHPIDLGKYQSQLVYSPHDYGPLVYDQTWFYDGFNQDTLMKDVWHDNWFFIIEDKIAPLLMGEWGGFMDDQHDADGRNRQWLTALRDLMIENRIHHTFWCFNENSGDTGGLLCNDFQDWDEVKYNFVKEALWQDENGKFISLDHKIKLGQGGNGISLSDYYSENPIPPNLTQPGTDAKDEIVYGDSNCDGTVDMSDAVLIMQSLSNPDKYGLGGTSETAITEKGLKNADVSGNGDGITNDDALTIQKFKLNLISSLPEIQE
ncbi:MAG: cellulase family glycosylhydrolase [Ruminococcus flavefaciens]|nr:cellulase family glycosylhydrolase [Ruminococcus flavefaciens]MCM1360703.1 cellulase family glycosylhydrolase [Clostridiales bacterium]MCM1435300.1 cellulase family glycosylhydrolase [Ruminococcus flavefaciens]